MMVVPVRPEEVPQDLICSICMSLPLVPAQTAHCEHVFCKECLHRSVSMQPICHIDRNECWPSQIRLVRDGSFAYRVWSSVTVKCEKNASGCSWTGSIADLTRHIENCQRGQQVQALKGELEVTIRDLEGENFGLKQNNRELISEQDRLRSALADLARENASEQDRLRSGLRSALAELARENALLQRKVETMDYPLIAANGGYAYNRTSVVRLTQFVCRNLEDKTVHIDSNRIYNCLKSC